MYLFIATIFIAELIIASSLISCIIKADKQIQKFNSEAMKVRPSLEKILKDFHFCVNSLGEYYNCMINSIKKRHRRFQINVVKNVVMYLSLFMLKGKYKRVAAFLQFAVLFYDYWQKIHTEQS